MDDGGPERGQVATNRYKSHLIGVCCEHGHDATQNMALCRRAAADRGLPPTGYEVLHPEVEFS